MSPAFQGNTRGNSGCPLWNDIHQRACGFFFTREREIILRHSSSVPVEGQSANHLPACIGVKENGKIDVLLRRAKFRVARNIRSLLNRRESYQKLLKKLDPKSYS